MNGTARVDWGLRLSSWRYFLRFEAELHTCSVSIRSTRTFTKRCVDVELISISVCCFFTVQVAQTHSVDIGAVVVEDGFNFKLFSTDGRVGQLQINEEVLPDDDLQRLANTDT